MSLSSFAPKYIHLKERRARLALFLVIVLTPIILFNLTFSVYAEETSTWDTTTVMTGTNEDTAIDSDGVHLALKTSASDSTYEEFARGNNLSDTFSMVAFLEDGGVTINQGYLYSSSSTIPLSTDVSDFYYENGLLYVSTYYSGLYVIDTKNTDDPHDDVVQNHYTNSSTPALHYANRVNAFIVSGDTLILGTETGMQYIDTQGTPTQTDDVRYGPWSTGWAHGNTISLDKVGNLIFAGTFDGLCVVDTKGTPDIADDTFITRYYTGSTPALGGQRVLNSFIKGNLLYVSTNYGLSVIDTNGTFDNPTDDTFVARYYTGSTPALVDDYISQAQFIGDLLYVSTNGGLTVIDTKGTNTATDDTLVTTYNTHSIPALDGDSVNYALSDGDFLYVSTVAGLDIIDTQGTFDNPADDTLYDRGSNPALVGFDAQRAMLVGSSLYVDTAAGLALFAPNTTGTYLSNPRSVASTGTTSLHAEVDAAGGQSVTLSYRTGTADAVWFDDFATTSSYVGDKYGWGAEFQDAAVTNGVLRLSNPSATWGGLVVFDTLKPANYFPAGSVVTARVKVNTERAFNDWLFLDDWEGGSVFYKTTNQWREITYVADTPFSDVGFEPWLTDGLGWGLEDSWEIDWLKITTPDSSGKWGSWTPCADTTLCLLSGMGTSTWLQYKLDLDTTDANALPSVTQVTYRGDYESVGTYTSETTTFPKNRDLGVFTPTATIPASTTVSYEYSINRGATWVPVTPGQNLADDNVVAKYFTWRVHLGTTNRVYTPIVTSVSLTHSPHPVTTSTSLQAQINQLEANGNHEAVARLKAEYPHLFDGTASDEEIQRKMVNLLAQVIPLLREFIDRQE